MTVLTFVGRVDMQLLFIGDTIMIGRFSAE